MKSRLIKFACHHCGTKLAVPPEMAGVTDQCPKCGTTITAPPESTLEAVRRKTKFGPVPTSPPPHESHAGQEMPTLPGWSASELADALKPPAPLPAYAAPHAESPPPQPQPQPQLQSGSPERGLLPDPPAIPDPGPTFVPKRKAQSEGAVAVAPDPASSPAPAPAKNEHPVLGSILGALLKPKSRAEPEPTPASEMPPMPPGPMTFPTSEKPLPTEDTARPAPASQPASEPPEAAPSILPPLGAETLPPAEMPAELLTKPAASADSKQDPSAAVFPPLPELGTAPEPSLQPQELPHAPSASEVTTLRSALVPESLPDPRAAEDAAMPGMGEMLAGGQIAQDPSAPPDTRDHRPLLYVPFLPVAESPAKGRRSHKRKLYILGVILFLVIDAVLLFMFLKAPPGSLSGEATENTAKNTAASTEPTSAAGTQTDPTPAPASSAPAIDPPENFAATQPDTSGSSKPAAPPMAIPMPDHTGANVPTATPVPAAPAEPKTAQSTAPAPVPAPTSSTPAPATPSDSANMKAPEATTAENTAKSAPASTAVTPTPATTPVSPESPAPPSSKGTAAATTPGPAPTPAPAPPPATGSIKPDASVAALMGPQPPTGTMATADGDPPWLKRISPIFPAIDGTPLLPSSTSQPVSPPPPLPPAPANTEGMSIPSVASTTNVATTPPPGAPAPPEAPPQATPPPAPETSSITVNKVPEEAASALDVLRKFLAAPTWQERSAYVQKPEEVKPAMEKHAAKYGDGPTTPGSIKFVDRHPGRDGGPPYCMFEIEGGDLKHPVLVLIEQPAQGQPRIDWPTFVEFKDDLLLKFLETKGEPNQSFRVMLSRKHYFAKDVPDLSSKDSFQVQQPNDRFDGHVFLPKNTPLSKKLATQLGWNQNMPVIVELAWRTNGKLHWVEMVRIVSYGWRG